jgi:threonine/homoserine/homoserine lactone efflux protein
MNALIASRSVLSLRAGVVTGFGAMSADLVLGALMYALRAEVDLGSVVRYIYAVGALVMAYLGYRLLTAPRPDATPSPAGLRTYSQALAVGLSNPFQIIWWLTAGLAFAYLGGLVLYVALFVAVLAWVLAFPYALHLGTRRHPSVARAVVYASGAILVGFAAYFAYLAV